MAQRSSVTEMTGNRMKANEQIARNCMHRFVLLRRPRRSHAAKPAATSRHQIRLRAISTVCTHHTKVANPILARDGDVSTAPKPLRRKRNRVPIPGGLGADAQRRAHTHAVFPPLPAQHKSAFATRAMHTFMVYMPTFTFQQHMQAPGTARAGLKGYGRLAAAVSTLRWYWTTNGRAVKDRSEKSPSRCVQAATASYRLRPA